MVELMREEMLWKRSDCAVFSPAGSGFISRQVFRSCSQREEGRI